MATLFGLSVKMKFVDLRTFSEHQKPARNGRLHSNGSKNLTRKIERKGSKHD